MELKFFNLNKMILIILFIFFISIFVWQSIFLSYTLLSILINSFTFLLFILFLIQKNDIKIHVIDLVFLLFSIYLILHLSVNFTFEGFIQISIITFSYLAGMYFRNSSIKIYQYPFKMVKYISFFLSISVLFSYLFPELFLNIYSMIFHEEIINKVKNQMDMGYYTGLTNEVGFTAGLICLGIASTFITFIVTNKVNKIDLFIFITNIFGLLMTQKRGHLLFLILALIIIYMLYSKNIEVILKNLMKISISLILLVPFSIFIYLYTNLGYSLFNRFVDSYYTFLEGEDITSNRIYLYQHALSIAKENPLVGIGWGNFSETVVGTVTIRTEMMTHNIYLQMLAEIGIVGILIFLVLATLLLSMSITLILRIKKSSIETFIVMNILFVQLLFLLYGLTGNPLYDLVYSSIFFFMSSLVVNIYIQSRNSRVRV